MAQVLVRDLDPGLVELLKDRAQKNGRSLEAELRIILKNAVSSGTHEVWPKIEKIRAMFADRNVSDSTELIREDRDL